MNVSPQRRRMLLALPGALAGCISVDVGTGTSAAHTRYVLEDPGRKDPARQAGTATASPLIPALVVQSLSADPLVDSSAIVYSRAEHERSTYALSSWTDRPSRRIAWLLRRRLQDAGTFGAVVALGQPVRTPWLLSVTIVSAYHDVRSEPGHGVVALTAELLDQHARRQQARQEFREEEPAAEANAAAATAAIGRATARVFDALVRWLEAELRRTLAGAA